MVATRQREPHGYSMCCLRIFCAFISVIIILNPCASYTILLYALCQINYYHTIYITSFLTIVSINGCLDGDVLFFSDSIILSSGQKHDVVNTRSSDFNSNVPRRDGSGKTISNNQPICHLSPPENKKISKIQVCDHINKNIRQEKIF